MSGVTRHIIATLAFLLALDSPAGALAAVLNVNSTADDLTAGDGQCTLREAIINANTDSDTTAGDCQAGSGADEIVLPAGNFVLSIEGADEDEAAKGDLDIFDDLTISGQGAGTTVIDSEVVGVLLNVHSADVYVERLTLTGAGEDGTIVDLLGTPSSAGIFASGGSQPMSVAVVDSEVSNKGVGISIFSGYEGAIAEVALIRSAITGNYTRTRGCAGGVMLLGLFGSVRALVENSTISWNTVDGGGTEQGVGGGIACLGCDLTVINGTISHNISLQQMAICGFGTAMIINSITLGGCTPFDVVVTSGGHNIGNISNPLFACGLTDPTDLPNTDPMLGPLQDNGGPTWTHALQLGSPAIDAIASEACSLTTDQRGVRRPLNGDGGGPNLCDIGAYEVTACADGLDNDGDGHIDFDGGATAGLPAGELTDPDPQCVTARSLREHRRRCGLGFELALLLSLACLVRRRTQH